MLANCSLGVVRRDSVVPVSCSSSHRLLLWAFSRLASQSRPLPSYSCTFSLRFVLFNFQKGGNVLLLGSHGECSSSGCPGGVALGNCLPARRKTKTDLCLPPTALSHFLDHLGSTQKGPMNLPGSTLGSQCVLWNAHPTCTWSLCCLQPGTHPDRISHQDSSLTSLGFPASPRCPGHRAVLPTLCVSGLPDCYSLPLPS